jgi:tRNA(Ile)-lysidine synthase
VSRSFAVAFSGGRDSTALLHASLAPAAALGLRVHALHVHHGLHPAADAWLADAERECRRWAAAGAPLEFHAHRLTGAPARGASVEAWARRERYAALTAMARACGTSLVLLAHHRLDQAETFLLQALRGAGVAGLAAMPREAERDGIVWARPWIGIPRRAIDAYVKRERLRFVGDPTNEDPRFARSRLRCSVWPSLAGAFADADSALAAAARRAHAAREALDAFAAEVLAGVREDGSLELERWLALPPPQREPVLRAWLREHLGRGAPDALVERLRAELTGRAPARWPIGPGLELRRYRGRLTVHDAPRGERRPMPASLRIAGPGIYEVPAWRGALSVTATDAGGIAWVALRHCELRPRGGSERFQAAPNRPPRSLKKQFQAAAIAPWQRAAPLLYCDGRLAWVAGLGVDANALAQAGEPQAHLQWLADAPA